MFRIFIYKGRCERFEVEDNYIKIKIYLSVISGFGISTLQRIKSNDDEILKKINSSDDMMLLSKINKKL